MTRYTYLWGRVDIDGWYRIWLRREDGQVIKMDKSRFRKLKQQGRVLFGYEQCIRAGEFPNHKDISK